MLSDCTPEDMATFETCIAAGKSKDLLEGFYLEDSKPSATFPFDQQSPNAWHLYNEFLNCLMEEARRANRGIYVTGARARVLPLPYRLFLIFFATFIGTECRPGST